MSQRKKNLNTYTLTLKVLPNLPVWSDSSEHLSLVKNFRDWLEKFQSPLLEMTNCNLLLDSKYIKTSRRGIKPKDFIGAIISFKATNEDLVCEWIDDLPTSNKYSWNFEILKSCEFIIQDKQFMNLT